MTDDSTLMMNRHNNPIKLLDLGQPWCLNRSQQPTYTKNTPWSSSGRYSQRGSLQT